MSPTIGDLLDQPQSDLGNVRAKVLMGISLLRAWGVPKNEAAAFRYFQFAAGKNPDAWGLYYLALCLEFGTGTQKDKQKAQAVRDRLSGHPGRGAIDAIGDDDIEARRESERFAMIASPHTKTEQKCLSLPGGGERCVDVQVTDNDQLQRDLLAIYAKYQRMLDENRHNIENKSGQ